MLEKFAKVFKLRKFKAFKLPSYELSNSTVTKISKEAHDDIENFYNFVPALSEPIYDEAHNLLYIGHRGVTSGKLMHDSKVIPYASDDKLLSIKEMKPIGYVAPDRFVSNIKINDIANFLDKTDKGVVNLKLPTFQHASFPAGWSMGDLNMNGILDAEDYALMKEIYFKGVDNVDRVSVLYGKYSTNVVNYALNINRDSQSAGSLDYLLLKRAFYGTYAYSPSDATKLGNNTDATKSWVAYSNNDTNEMYVYMDVKLDGGAVTNKDNLLIIRGPGLEDADIEYTPNSNKSSIRIKRQFCPTVPTKIVIIRNITPTGASTIFSPGGKITFI